MFGSQDNSLGYRFTANSDVSVSALGYYDPGGVSLTATHEVGIFSSAGTLLASATVSNAGFVLDDFRYANLGSALSLTGGLDYYIAGTTLGADLWVYQASNIVTDPAISYVASYFVSSTGGVLAFPANLASAREYMTVNFLIDGQPAAVPEPSTWALACVAMVAGLGGYVRKYRRRAA